MKQIAQKTFVSLLGILAAPFGALAAQPTEWGISLQEAATEQMRQITWFNQYTLYYLVPIVLLVLGLLTYIAVRFNPKANPVASKTSHNTLIEVVWTIVPCLILVFIALPSFRMINYQLIPPEPEMRVKVTGYQWYWDYAYLDHGIEDFSSLMLAEESDDEDELTRASMKKIFNWTDTQVPRLLAVDNELVVPVDTIVQVLVTAGDVMHAATVPAFGIKVDAVPGRTNSMWFKAEKEGVYYGQCSELCGKDHSFMPFVVRVVSKSQFEAWVETVRENDSDTEEANLNLWKEIAEKNMASAR